MTNQRVVGTAKFFNVKIEYGFINSNDTREDTFVHHTTITRNNQKKIKRSVGEGEIGKFSIMEGAKG